MSDEQKNESRLWRNFNHIREVAGEVDAAIFSSYPNDKRLQALFRGFKGLVFDFGAELKTLSAMGLDSSTQDFLMRYCVVPEGGDVFDVDGPLKNDTPQMPRFFTEMEEAYKAVDTSRIEKYLKSLDYPDFLSTPYWRIIAAHVKAIKGEVCCACPATGRVDIHHRTYDHHGRELEFWRLDLNPFCRDCHNKLHVKKRDELPESEPEPESDDLAPRKGSQTSNALKSRLARLRDNGSQRD